MSTPDATRTAAVEGEGPERSSLQQSDITNTTDPELEKSIRNSGSHWGAGPGFEIVDGEIDGRGYNETSCDVIAVPCVGAAPIDTWVRDPLGEGYFTLPAPVELEKYSTVKRLPASSVLTPTIDRVLPKASHLWIRQGIRKEVSKARVMLYRHRELAEGITIEQAADDLLIEISRMRDGLKRSRPIFFICHSIGGLVVKAALVKAKKDDQLKHLVFDCHGITFFATPHRGSSYLSMPHLRDSIAQLLYLERPLPSSITQQLRLGHKPLLKLHDKFVDLASEIRIWTFYETVDSQLSGLVGCDFDQVHFSAPITSIKSGLVRTRAEQALSIESDHAHCASFGPHNLQIMHSYLCDLGIAVHKAESLSLKFIHTPLQLSSKVRVEIIGFYEDPDGETEQDVRLYVSKHHLDEFLAKGPEECLRERLLSRVPAKSKKGSLPFSRRLASSPSRVSGALGIFQGLGQRILGSSPSRDKSQSPNRDLPSHPSPEIVVTTHMPRRPSFTGVATEPLATTSASPSPMRSRGLTVPALSTPGFNQPSTRRDSTSAGSESDRSRPSSEPIIPEISPRAVEHTTDESQTDDEVIENMDPRYARKSRRDRVSRASAMQDLTAGFSRPSPNRRKFLWIHVPFNNPHWVKGIFEKLSEVQNRSYTKLLSNDNWTSKHIQGRNANFHVSYVKPGCGFVPAEANSPRPSPSDGRDRSASPSISPAHIYLYIPYLHFDTYVNLIRRRNIIERRLKHGRTRPVPKDVAELESLDSRVIWEYIGHDPPLNARRTLDQYGYPSLQDTWARDDDQMLYKLTKERITSPFLRKRDMYHTGDDPVATSSPISRLVSVADTFMKSEGASRMEETEAELEEDIIDGKVLMVDQLWLWAVDTTTLMTFFPKRESHPTEGPLFQQADLRNSIYNELNGDLTGRCDNALDLAAFVTLHAVTVLMDRTSHPDLEVFRIFEEALGILTERMTSSLKRFRMQSYRKIHEDSDSDDPDDNSAKRIKKRHQRELERAERENRENTSAVLELRDLEDELHTLLNLFSEQQEAIGTMKRCYEKSELQGFTERGRAFLVEALKRLDEYSKQAHDMLERVDATRRDFEKLQELVQRQASVDEAKWTRLQTELASSQNLSVMIFTTFTVIFLPLSFFTSLFGMNTQEWGGPDPNNFISLRTIGAISLPGSALLIGITLIAAFSSRVQIVFKFFFRVLTSAIEHTNKHFLRLEPKASKRAKEKRMQVRELRKKHNQRKRERGYDFWETVRAERRSEYQIPDSNRKGAMNRRIALGRGTWGRMLDEN
ncbi:hypothetical protein F5Y18DRAFT_358399 [Xylariaceae sp. FL1019]|nr:hypothetical protein F5Y18DRAFT_358399 [Xylariaceae sp. FL1019]